MQKTRVVDEDPAHGHRAPGRMLPHGTTLAEVAETATFLASDRA